MARLKALAEKHVVSSPAKLHLLAQRMGVPHAPVDLKPALEEDVGKQILAPLPKYRGVSAATRPGGALQADLADFQNGKVGAHHYFLLVSDVFTRRAWAEPLRFKTAEATNKELKAILKEVPGGGREAAVSTDNGKEFKRIDSVLEPLGAEHRLKQAKNDIAVVDRTMQTLKVKLGEARANAGGNWKQSLDKVVAGYNATPHPTVHGAPETAGDENIQHFMIQQDQSENFHKNYELTEERKRRLESLGAFREAIPNGGRSFKPAYGPVRKLKEVAPGAGYVVDEAGNRALLKRVQAVNAASAEPKAVFETKVQVRRPEGRKRAKKPMEKPVPAAASKVFSSPSGLPEAERAAVPTVESAPRPETVLPRGVMAELIANQKATYQPKRTMAQIQAEAAEKKRQREAEAAAKKKEREAAKEAEKARMAQIRLESKALDKQIREDERRRKQK